MVFHLILFTLIILVPRGCNPFGQHHESRPLAAPNPRSLLFTDFDTVKSDKSGWLKITKQILCACSKRSEVSILDADQKDCALWGRQHTYVLSFPSIERIILLYVSHGWIKNSIVNALQTSLKM